MLNYGTSERIIFSITKIANSPILFPSSTKSFFKSQTSSGLYHTSKRCASTMFSKTLSHKEKKLIPVPLEVMYDVVADVGQYKEFVPWCTKSLVTHQTKQTAKAELAVGFGPVQEHYKSTLIYNRPKYIKSICTDGKLFNMLDCTWKFSKGLSPSSCIIAFDVSFEFRSIMYTKLAQMFFDEVVKKMVVSFEARAKESFTKKQKLL